MTTEQEKELRRALLILSKLSKETWNKELTTHRIIQEAITALLHLLNK